MIDPAWWAGRRVFLTGHTGFKGSWLTLWLHRLGAEVSGFALEPETRPNLFDVLGLRARCDHQVGDVRDAAALREAVRRARPQVVLHLAAQSLVRRSYRAPLETFDVNVMGTANLLDACRDLPDLESIVVVTTDKVYQNLEDGRAFPESGALGGDDPYSASKAAAELVAHSYRSSHFGGRRVATARSGNVIGGGDWSEDRLIPDAVRAFSEGRPLLLRNPDSVRPWQHVIEPLSGYLMLAEALARRDGMSRAWNFGPSIGQRVTVHDLVRSFAAAWGDGARWKFESEPGAPSEAGLLALDSSAARDLLGWAPRTAWQGGLEATAAWYRSFYAGEEMLDVSLGQLEGLS